MDKLILKTVFVSYIPLFLAMPVEASDIASAYGQTIKLASGYEQLIKESPATVSVITKEDIKRIGAGLIGSQGADTDT
jgi:outer membrane receptor for ferrienterochelin and colicin